MKRLAIVLILLTCATSFAQKHHDEKREYRKEMRKDRLDLSPEQVAELTWKKLTLVLDLNEGQQKDVRQISLKQAKLRKEAHQKRKNEKKLSEEDRFKARIARLDNKIVHKKQMKSILNEDQYKKWEKINIQKKRGKRECQRKRGLHGEKR